MRNQLQLRARFWIEAGLALASFIFAVLTIVWRDWIEIVFRVDPDHHSGSLEWGIVLVAAAVTIAFAAAARVEWRKRVAASAQS
jgi:hypothetical protein